MEKASERYKQLLELNKQMHEKQASGFNGQSLINVICQIGVLIQKFGCTSLLDYGCGRGDAQRHFNVDALWGVRYFGYDPAVEGFPESCSNGAGVSLSFGRTLPADKFDAVISTDVLEHVPEDDLLGWVLDEIFSKAEKFVFIKVPTYEVEQWLPNGENVHCTVKPQEWWAEKLQEFSNKYNVPFGAVIKTRPEKGVDA